MLIAKKKIEEVGMHILVIANRIHSFGAQHRVALESASTKAAIDHAESEYRPKGVMTQTLPVPKDARLQRLC